MRKKIPKQTLISVFCTGSLHEVKGQTFLIEACRRLRLQGISINCNFIGDGPDRQNLMNQADRAGIKNHVIFHGIKNSKEVAELIKKADILVAPSVPTKDGRREGIPVALMEGMACGIPVIASHLSGIPELISHNKNGLLTTPGDPTSLTITLLRLCLDPALRKQLGENGRQTILRDFNLYLNAKKMIQFFQEPVVQ